MACPTPNSLRDAGIALAFCPSGTMNRHVAAVVLGREGGKSTSPAKVAAAKVNGALGGRPVGS